VHVHTCVDVLAVNAYTYVCPSAKRVCAHAEIMIPHLVARNLTAALESNKFAHLY
jgi:hypothetical protein